MAKKVTPCNQIKIMSFLQVSLDQSDSASPKATTLYVYNMSLYLVACLLNRWKKSKQCKVPRKRGQRLDHATKLEASFPGSSDVIATEIRLCPACPDLGWYVKTPCRLAMALGSDSDSLPPGIVQYPARNIHQSTLYGKRIRQVI
jgi:hypothetical protein